MTEQELVEAIILQVVDRAESFVAGIGDPRLQNMTDEQYEFFASGAVAASKVLLEAVGDLAELGFLGNATS